MLHEQFKKIIAHSGLVDNWSMMTDTHEREKHPHTDLCKSGNEQSKLSVVQV